MRLLFICTGNTCRSPMAEQIAKSKLHEAGIDCEVTSAGLYTSEGMPMAGHAADALIRRHIPLNQHASKPLTDDLVESATLILTMTRSQRADLISRFPEANDKTFALGEYTSQSDGTNEPKAPGCDIVDPYGGSSKEYEVCAQMIEAAIDEVVRRLSNA